MRKVWKLNPRAGSVYLPALAGRPEIRVQLMQRFIKFFYYALQSKNPLVALVSKMCTYSTSNVADNVRIVLCGLSANNVGELFEMMDIQKCKRVLANVYACSAEVIRKAAIIKELYNMREGVCSSNLSKKEILEILEVCTSTS